MRHSHFNRRQFLAAGSLAAGAALTSVSAAVKGRSATDLVTLGKTGIKLSRLGIGLGSNGGRVQHDLGQEGFNRLVRYAFDKGVRYLDCAQSYKTFNWVADAIKGLPRDQLFILSKIGGNPGKPEEVIDNHLKNFRTDYIDCILLHCAVTATWPQERARLMEAIDKAKEQGKIRSKGISCHALPALRVAAESEWVEVNLVRVNPQAVLIDSETPSWNVPGKRIEPVLDQLSVMKKNNHGVIGMKLIGEGAFKQPEERERSIRFVMKLPEIDAATIGFKNTGEIDEAILRINGTLGSA